MNQNPLAPVRQKIDAIDRKLRPLFEERMRCADEVAQIKQREGIPIFNPQREAEILASMGDGNEFGTYTQALYAKIFALSREHQHRMLDTDESLPPLPADALSGTGTICIRFDISDTPGALCAVLERFAVQNLNITEVEASAAASEAGQSSVRLQFAGDLRSADVRRFLTTLAKEVQHFTFL